TPLAAHVKALPELARRIAFIGIVADDWAGAALQPQLKPGQQLVTTEGAVWRWDGYVMRAGAPSTAAVRLSQRNPLAESRPPGGREAGRERGGISGGSAR